MKFYSEKLKKLFNSAEELEAEEAKLAHKEEEKTIIKNKVKKSIGIVAKEMNAIIDILAADIDWTTQEEEEIISDLFGKLLPLLTKIRMM